MPAVHDYGQKRTIVAYDAHILAERYRFCLFSLKQESNSDRAVIKISTGIPDLHRYTLFKEVQYVGGRVDLYITTHWLWVRKTNSILVSERTKAPEKFISSDFRTTREEKSRLLQRNFRREAALGWIKIFQDMKWRKKGL